MKHVAQGTGIIVALDHLVLRASFDDAAVQAYETLSGRHATDGKLSLGNVGLAIESAAGTAHLATMVFATEDLDKAERLLERRAVRCSRAGEQLVLDPAVTHQVPIALIQRKDRPPPSPLMGADEAASIVGLDHVVIRTPDPERAVAFYGGRLGLDLRLDRSNPQWGARLLFFRCGDVVVEIAHDLAKGVSDGPDRLWGLSWRTPDIGRAYARLQKAGVEVSPPRAGRRPGTQVFSVQSHTANVPTIVIGGVGRW